MRREGGITPFMLCRGEGSTTGTGDGGGWACSEHGMRQRVESIRTRGAGLTESVTEKDMLSVGDGQWRGDVLEVKMGGDLW